jgi:hypothetical protein
VEVVLLELVDYKLDTKETVDKKAKKEEKKSARKEKADIKPGVHTEKKAGKV